MASTGGPEAETALDALVMTSFEVIGRLGVVATRHGLSLTQVRMLATLRDREPTMSDLARHLGLDKSSISGLVDRAVGRDLVRRFADPVDARSSRIALTAAGAGFVQRVEEDAVHELRPLLDRLSDRQERDLGGLLGRLLEPAAAAPAGSRTDRLRGSPGA